MVDIKNGFPPCTFVNVHGLSFFSDQSEFDDNWHEKDQINLKNQRKYMVHYFKYTIEALIKVGAL